MTRPAARVLVDALTIAHEFLTQPCTLCRCTRRQVSALDVDPDCPGLHRTADGCLTGTLAAARLVLAAAGVPAAPTNRTVLRRLVADAVDDVTQLLDTTPETLASIAERIRTAPVAPPAERAA